MNTELTPTARAIAAIGVKTYREHMGFPAEPADIEKNVAEIRELGARHSEISTFELGL